MILLAFFWYAASAPALPNDPGVTWLKAGPEVVAEYCATERDNSPSCTVPNGDVALISLPDELKRIVSAHVAMAFESRFFDELSLLDFFHGHFILGGGKAKLLERADGKKVARYTGAPAFFVDTSVLLYHSAEYTYRWQRGDHRPRSFVGWTDPNEARIQPAIDLMKPEMISTNYKNSGTVQPEELVKSMPGLSDLTTEKIEIELCQNTHCRICQTDSMLVILPAQGRNQGHAVRPYLRCAFPPEDGGELKFSIQPRPHTVSAPPAVHAADLVRISPRVEVDFADTSAPDLSDPAFIRLYTTAGEVLTWTRREGASVADTLRLEKPKYSRLRLCHTDGNLLNEQAGEDVWDPTIHNGILYAGAMTVPRGRKHASWPDDNWSRRTYPFKWNGSCWVMQAKPLWGERPSRVTWTGHNYGHEFITGDDGTTYVFYERVSDDSNGQPWKTELFARKMISKFRASDQEIAILRVPQTPWPSARRYSGGSLIEGARPFRAAGKFLISFSAGEYTSDNYGIHLAWADRLEGPYTPYMNGRDLKNFARSVQRQRPLAWGAGRAVFFEDNGAWWSIFHGIEGTEIGDEGKRALYLAPVSIKPRKQGPPRIQLIPEAP